MDEMNIIHQLYYALGCDLTAQPETWKEVSMIGFQFLAASIFFLWFVKYLFTVLRGLLRGGQ